MIVSIYGGQSYAGYMYRIYSLHADHYKVIFLILMKNFMEYLHRDIFCAYTCILMSILITTIFTEVASNYTDVTYNCNCNSLVLSLIANYNASGSNSKNSHM